MMLNNMAKEHMQYHAESGISRFQERRICFSFLTISILPVLVCIIMLGANNLATYKRQLDTSVMDGMHQFTNNYLIYMEIMDACAEHMDGRIEDGMSKMEIPAQLSSYEYNYPQIASIFYFEKTSNCIFTSEGEMPICSTSSGECRQTTI